MSIVTEEFAISTEGFSDTRDITGVVTDIANKSSICEGFALIFVPGSTAGVTTIEFKPGVVEDLKEAVGRQAPANQHYHHDVAWGDGNGFSHVRAALMGASLTIPFKGGRLLLGTWQQIVLIDFDNRPRERRVIVQIHGE